MTELATQREEWSPYAAVVRLLAGAIGFGLEQLQRIEGELADRDVVLEAPALEADWGTAGALFVGFVADLPDRVTRSADTLSRAAAPVRSAAEPVGRLLSRTALGAVMSELRGTFAAEGERLAAIGRSEYLRGRVVAESVAGQGVDAVVEYLGDSDAVDDFVHEQAFGVGRGAVQEVRETGAAADGLSEAMFRRLLRREPRRLPPEPGSNDG